MANADRPVGFTPAEDCPYYPPKPWPVVGSAAIAKGDMVTLNSDGYVCIDITGAQLGVADSSVTASSSAGDTIMVFDNPNQIFQGQCSGDGALADPYTTRSAAACFDIEGTTGIMEINENATSALIVKIVGVGKEPNGEKSAVGTNQKKLFRISRPLHLFGTIA
jgi:hypothetical protein